MAFASVPQPQMQICIGFFCMGFNNALAYWPSKNLDLKK